MDHNILHFFTGTMAFRIPRTSRRRNDAEIPDAFFISSSIRKNQNAGKAAKKCSLCKIDAGLHGKTERNTNTPKDGGKNMQGEKRILGNGSGEQRKIRKVTHDATTARQSRTGSTAMQREFRIGGRAEYQACGADGGSDEESNALAAGI